MFLSAWLRDNLDRELIADLLNLTENRLHSSVADWMPALEEDQRRMLNWWATEIARNPELAQIFNRLSTTAGFKFPETAVLLLSVGGQFQSWVTEIACGVWQSLQSLRSLCPRVEQAVIAILGIFSLLFQDAKVPVATSIVATSIVAPALASSDTVSEPNDLAPPPPRCSPSRRPGASSSVQASSVQASSKGRRAAGGSTRSQVSVLPLRVERTVSALPLRVERTIGRQWRRLAAARKSAHSAFIRLVRDAHPRQSKGNKRRT